MDPFTLAVLIILVSSLVAAALSWKSVPCWINLGIALLCALVLFKVGPF
jgi:hypothetical protein